VRARRVVSEQTLGDIERQARARGQRPGDAYGVIVDLMSDGSDVPCYVYYLLAGPERVLIEGEPGAWIVWDADGVVEQVVHARFVRDYTIMTQAL
jgi:hypothetical protein